MLQRDDHLWVFAFFRVRHMAGSDIFPPRMWFPYSQIRESSKSNSHSISRTAHTPSSSIKNRQVHVLLTLM